MICITSQSRFVIEKRHFQSACRAIVQQAEETGQSAKDFCVMHVISNAKGKLISFIDIVIDRCKFIPFAEKWGRFQCKEGEIALASESKLLLKLHSTCHYSETTSSSECLAIAHTGVLQVPPRML